MLPVLVTKSIYCLIFCLLWASCYFRHLDIYTYIYTHTNRQILSKPFQSLCSTEFFLSVPNSLHIQWVPLTCTIIKKFEIPESWEYLTSFWWMPFLICCWIYKFLYQFISKEARMRQMSFLAIGRGGFYTTFNFFSVDNFVDFEQFKGHWQKCNSQINS